MQKLSYEAMDVTELENVMGGADFKYVGCIITNGKCSAEGGCGICNGKCGDQDSDKEEPEGPVEPDGPTEEKPDKD